MAHCTSFLWPVVQQILFRYRGITAYSLYFRMKTEEKTMLWLSLQSISIFTLLISCQFKYSEGAMLADPFSLFFSHEGQMLLFFPQQCLDFHDQFTLKLALNQANICCNVLVFINLFNLMWKIRISFNVKFFPLIHKFKIPI